MIIFKKLRYQNILSTGNQFTEIDFQRSKSTLIVGENGQGKSTFIDALCFCLYGKPFRKINKPQIINAITKKNLLTEVEFSIGTTEYLVRRGMSPAIFEIYQNGNLIEQDASPTDYQDILTKTILKMNMKSFTQIVVLGSADYIPFMKLSTPDRRMVIEDLMDLQIFTVMNKVLKQKMDTTKKEIDTNEHEIDIVERSIEIYENNLSKMKEDRDDIINLKNSKINSLKEELRVSQEIVANLQNELNSKLLLTEPFSKLEKRRDKIVNFETTLESDKRLVNKEIKFFQDNDSCPTCTQEITFEFKTQSLEKKKNKGNELDKALTKLQEEYIKVTSEIADIAKIQDECRSLNNKIQDEMFKQKTCNNTISLLEDDITKILNSNKQLETSETEIIDLNKKKETLVDLKYKLIEKKNIQLAATSFLKDTGFKSRLIKKYIPIINQTVNQYLASLDFFVNFELDENFDETIKSRHRDKFSYANFSEGEKFRIDLSLMFTWRALAKMRNSAATNLLIMDEVCDGSLDDNGIEDFMKMLNQFMTDTNVFVISHKGDSLYDRFHSVIEFRKEKNFSRIV